VVSFLGIAVAMENENVEGYWLWPSTSIAIGSAIPWQVALQHFLPPFHRAIKLSFYLLERQFFIGQHFILK